MMEHVFEQRDSLPEILLQPGDVDRRQIVGRIHAEITGDGVKGLADLRRRMLLRAEILQVLRRQRQEPVVEVAYLEAVVQVEKVVLFVGHIEDIGDTRFSMADAGLKVQPLRRRLGHWHRLDGFYKGALFPGIGLHWMDGRLLPLLYL